MKGNVLALIVYRNSFKGCAGYGPMWGCPWLEKL